MLDHGVFPQLFLDLKLGDGIKKNDTCAIMIRIIVNFANQIFLYLISL